MWKIISLFLFIFGINFCFSQENDDCCGTKELNESQFSKLFWYNNNEQLYNFLDSIGYYDDVRTIFYQVPLKFWIYRKSDKTGGASDQEIKTYIMNLNFYNAKNNTGFRYYLQDVEYINSDRHTIMGYYWELGWQTMLNKEDNCINVHIVDEINKMGNKLFGTYNYLSEAVVVKRVSSATSLTHEIGHYFGLFHPHRNWDKRKGKQEPVSRTRRFDGIFDKRIMCEVNGDALCDTPAEPSLSNDVTENCLYTGMQFDKWGDQYKPNTDNIMSYPTYRQCRKNFTAGQIAVMLKTASENSTAKNWYVGNGNIVIYDADIFEPDNLPTMATEIPLNTLQYHTFHRIFIKKGKNEEESIDWVKFNVTVAGDYEIVISDGKSINPNAEITLYDATAGKVLQIANPDLSKKQKNATIKKNLSPATYYLKIEKKTSASGNSILDYNLMVKKL